MATAAVNSRRWPGRTVVVAAVGGGRQQWPGRMPEDRLARRFFVFQPFDSPETKGVGHPSTPRARTRAFAGRGAACCTVRRRTEIATTVGGGGGARNVRRRRTRTRAAPLKFTVGRRRRWRRTAAPAYSHRPDVHPSAADRPPTKTGDGGGDGVPRDKPNRVRIAVSQSVDVRRAFTVCSLYAIVVVTYVVPRDRPLARYHA